MKTGPFIARALESVFFSLFRNNLHDHSNKLRIKFCYIESSSCAYPKMGGNLPASTICAYGMKPYGLTKEKAGNIHQQNPQFIRLYSKRNQQLGVTSYESTGVNGEKRCYHCR
jgi:hypothetical protein